jgi:hypothetical protein
MIGYSVQLPLPGYRQGLLQPLLVRVRGFDPPALKQKQLIG